MFLTSILNVQPSKLSSLTVEFRARAWQSNCDGWSSRASRGLDKSNNWRDGVSVSARMSGMTSTGLEAPAALTASKFRDLRIVSPRQLASKLPSRHLETLRERSLQSVSLLTSDKWQRYYIDSRVFLAFRRKVTSIYYYYFFFSTRNTTNFTMLEFSREILVECFITRAGGHTSVKNPSFSFHDIRLFRGIQ